MSPLFKKPKYSTISGVSTKKNIPEGLWIKCRNCEESILQAELTANLLVCPKCDYHNPMPFDQRLALLIDEGTFVESDANLMPMDPLEFINNNESYATKLVKSQKKTGINEAVVTGMGKIDGHNVGIAVMDFRFLGASMGSVVGEKITRLIEACTEQRCPVIIISTSGGARMHEGALSLMQMAKTSAALARHHEAGLIYIAVLTHPTTGGVTASFASLGDLIIAEPGALIGFAGPRVIKQTTQATLPEGFQTSEFLLDKGFVDRIIERASMREELARLLDYTSAANDSD